MTSSTEAVENAEAAQDHTKHLSEAFESICDARAALEQAPGVLPGIKQQLETQALQIAQACPAALQPHLRAAARSGSRKLFMLPAYRKDSLRSAEIDALATWLTAEDIPALLRKAWLFNNGCLSLTIAFRDRKDIQTALLQGLESLDVVMNPGKAHPIFNEWDFTCGTTPQETAFAARLIEIMVRKHPDLASADLDICIRGNDGIAAIALILAGAAPGPTADTRPPGGAIMGATAHDRLKIFQEHGPLEAYLARTEMPDPPF